MKEFKRGQKILIIKGKNKGEVGEFCHYIDDNYLTYSLGAGHRAKIHVNSTEHYVRKFKGVPVTELISVCWV